jgi:ABC-type ATPase involved in cell division
VVFQDFKLLPRRTVEENVALALEVLGTPRRQVRGKVFGMLKRVGLQHRRFHHPLSLSGGEQQRLAIARALVNEPEILLADEPTGNLDRRTGGEIQELLEGLHARGITLVIVTHDLEKAARARRVLWMEDGRIERELEGTDPVLLLRELQTNVLGRAGEK